MRVNSDETLRRAAAYRAAHSGSWLQLSRRADHQRRSREFFSGGREEVADAEQDSQTSDQ